MAGVGEDRVGDGDESCVEACVDCDADLTTGNGVKACSDHGNQGSDEDRDDSWNTEP